MTVSDDQDRLHGALGGGQGDVRPGSPRSGS